MNIFQKYIIYEKYIDSLSNNNSNLNNNINDYESILKELELLYSNIEYKMSKKMYSKL